MDSSKYSTKYNQEIWQGIRSKFFTSPMAELDLATLADNAGEIWEGDGSELTAEDFLNYDYLELAAHPALGDQERADKLVSILKETLAFDDPFSALIMEESPAEVRDSVTGRAERLGLPLDFPLSLSNLSENTRSICASEGIRTLGDFLEFSSRMARSVVIGEDFRALLNAINTGDEQVVSRYLPFRPGQKGLHLPEALGMIADRIGKESFLALVRHYGGSLNNRESQIADQVSEADLQPVQQTIQNHLGKIIAYFPSQKVALDEAAESQDSLQDYLAVLQDDKQERLLFAELWFFFNGEYPFKRSFLSRLAKLFRR